MYRQINNLLCIINNKPDLQKQNKDSFSQMISFLCKGHSEISEDDNWRSLAWSKATKKYNLKQQTDVFVCNHCLLLIFNLGVDLVQRLK